jgi:hypothetical protein
MAHSVAKEAFDAKRIANERCSQRKLDVKIFTLIGRDIYLWEKRMKGKVLAVLVGFKNKEGMVSSK